MQQWEYDSLPLTGNLDNIMERFDSKGKQGWELVATITRHIKTKVGDIRQTQYAIFKRPLT